jgi:hypothetical protein
MSPFDPNGTGAYVPVSRVKPITADFVGDSTKGGSSNLQTFADARRMLKAPCRVATAAALPAYTRTGNVITSDQNVSLNDAGIDGVTNLTVGNRVLLNHGAHGRDNGIYTVSVVGSASAAFVLTRAADADANHEMVKHAIVWVTEGTTFAGTCWRLQPFTDANPPNLNTDVMIFTQVPVAGTGDPPPAVPTYTLAPCTAATTGVLAMTVLNGVHTAVDNGALTVDGVDLQVGQRVLVKDGTVAGISSMIGNGAYTVTDKGSSTTPFVLTRDPAFASDDAVLGNTVLVRSGAVNAGTQWFVAGASLGSFMFSPLVAFATGGDITNATHLGGVAGTEYAQKPVIVEYTGTLPSLPASQTRDTIALVDLTEFPAGQTLTVMLWDAAPVGTRVIVKDVKGLFDVKDIIVKNYGGSVPDSVEGRTEVRLQIPFMSVTFVKASSGWWII